MVFPLSYVAHTHTHIDMITGLLKYATVSATPKVLTSYKLATSLLRSAEHFPTKKPEWAVQGQLSVRMGKQRMKLQIFIIFPIAWGNSLDFPTVSWPRVNWHFSDLIKFNYLNSDNELAGGGFLMNAANGFRNPNFGCNITTTIVLVCNSSAVWSSQDLTKIFSAKILSPCEVTEY